MTQTRIFLNKWPLELLAIGCAIGFLITKEDD